MRKREGQFKLKIMSKDLFMMMREREVMTDHFFPNKKEIQFSAKEFANELIESGNHNPQELLAQALRLKEALTVIEAEIRNSLPQEDFEAFGLKGKYVQGGNIPQYEEDEVYATLKKDLKDREELLKMALSQKDAFFDAYGNEVPKVSTKPRKSSLTIKY